MEFELESEYIELAKLLKVSNVVNSGGHAKILVEEGEIFVNGRQEFRKRAKLRKGDVVEIGEEIEIKLI